MPSESSPFTPSSILFRPRRRPRSRLVKRALVEAPGTAPGSEGFITMTVYRHIRIAPARGNIGIREAQGKPFRRRGFRPARPPHITDRRICRWRHPLADRSPQPQKRAGNGTRHLHLRRNVARTRRRAGRSVPAQRLRNLMEEIELADQLGLDVFGVGEHHRPDFAVSAPAVVLAAAAARTKTIRLTSAVTVLSSDDPVRVFQEFATLDLHLGRARRDHGRARLVHRVVPALRLRPRRLRLAVRREAASSCSRSATARRSPGRGEHRAPLNDLGVYPRPDAEPAAGLGRGRRHAAIGRACRHARPAAGARHHRRRAGALRAARRALPRGGRRAGHDAAKLPVGINSHGYVADTSQRRRPTRPSRRSPKR